MPSVLTIHSSRLATAPALRLIEAAPGRAVVRIDGLICALCAARTQRALAAVPGVEAVSIDLDGGTAEVRYAPGSTPDEAALRRALHSVVVAGMLRRWIARAVRAVTLRAVSGARAVRVD